MAIETLVFHREQATGERFRDIIQAHQYPVFAVARIDTSDANRIQPHQVDIGAARYQAINSSATDPEIDEPRRLPFAGKAESARVDAEAITGAAHLPGGPRALHLAIAQHLELIREVIGIEASAIEQLEQRFADLDLVFLESGGDNLAATFSPELVDLTIYVIDVAAGDKIPRKGGPGITKSDLLVINKIDLANQVGADLGVRRN